MSSTSHGPAGDGRPHISRRTIAQGITWATPAVLVAGAAPAFAASPKPPGLQGWVLASRGCNNSRLTIDFDSSPSNPGTIPAGGYGLWIFDATSTTQARNASVTVYVPTSWGQLSVSSSTGNSGWSTPVLDTTVTQIPAKRAYTTKYTGGWTFENATKRLKVNGRLHISGTSGSSNTCTSGEITARRYVEVQSTPNGPWVPYEFTRTITL